MKIVPDYGQHVVHLDFGSAVPYLGSGAFIPTVSAKGTPAGPVVQASFYGECLPLLRQPHQEFFSDEEEVMWGQNRCSRQESAIFPPHIHGTQSTP